MEKKIDVVPKLEVLESELSNSLQVPVNTASGLTDEDMEKKNYDVLKLEGAVDKESKLTNPMRKISKVFKDLWTVDRTALIDYFELPEEKIRGIRSLKKVMKEKGLFNGDGLKEFKISLKDIGRNDLYNKFDNSDMHVDDSMSHENFNTLLAKISRIMCEDGKILKELKHLFHQVLPGSELERATNHSLMKLLKKEGIIEWNNFSRLTSKLEFILGEKYDGLIGCLVRDYNIEISNGNTENGSTGSIEKKIIKEEESKLQNICSLALEFVHENGKPYIPEEMETEPIEVDSRPNKQNMNQMEDSIKNSPASKKRCFSNSSLEASDIEESYPMASIPHRNCLIFNNYFENNAVFPFRKATEKDGQQLKYHFEWLQFSVKTFNNCSAEEIKQKLLSEAEDEDKNSHDCLVVFILSHGFEGGVYGNNGQKLTFKNITGIFENCKAFIGKPKLYFIQACQGVEDMVTVSRDCLSLPSHTFPSPITNQSAPMKADQMMFIASPPVGYSSYRDKVYGSWFIQSLCKVFQKHARTCTLMSLATKVNMLMTKNSSTIDNKEVTAISCVSNFTLRKHFYFKPLGTFAEYMEKYAEEDMMLG